MMAAKFDLKLEQMDVSNAYLNGVLEEEIYMIPPEGVGCPKGHVWKLKKSIYGLKQAGRTWNIKLHGELTKIGFIRIGAEHCLYIFRDSDGKICFMVVYIDDLLLATNSKALMRKAKKHLGESFKVRDLGPASYILGIEIIRDHPN